MTDYDIYDLFAHHGYRARALKRPERKIVYLTDNAAWFDVHRRAGRDGAARPRPPV